MSEIISIPYRGLRCVAEDKITGRCSETFVHIQVEALAPDSPRK